MWSYNWSKLLKIGQKFLVINEIMSLLKPTRKIVTKINEFQYIFLEKEEAEPPT